MSDGHAAAERHASWLELFFDLVVVVAVGQLAHLVHGEAHHGPDALSIVTFFALYLAIWLVWTTFTLYANVVADAVRQQAMFVGMAGIALMAATVPHGMGERSTVFAVAYLVTAGVGASAFTRSGQVLLSWGAATRNAGLVPWVVSFWVHEPWWRLGLWLLGLAITVAFSVFGGRDDERQLAELNQRIEQRLEQVRDERRRERARREHPLLTAARLDPAHLGERLGLFVIIVLGEAMLQLIGAMSEVEDWSPGRGVGWVLLLTVAGGFVLLVFLWALNVRHGFAESTSLAPGALLPAHFVAIASITTIATGLGAAVTDSAEHLPTGTAWLLCGGVSAYLLVITSLARRPRWAWSALAAALPLAAGVAAPVLPAAAVVGVVLLAAAGQTWNLGRARG
ncbi:low temperature requirement protein A [Actinosynnema sp. NPDC020468]|uniref:low temperature requirement protein A n=1 Tax=Actinosynnema sp. NPDC020468 TaxID=3154488 RepID=UPI0033F76F7D